ncbi:MAG: CHAD domain-containing protein [Negativicutes bacterium]|nr:CHAD domain-containing protein [Negativicutes bacterium]
MPENTHTEVELKLRLLDPKSWASVLTAPALTGLDASALESKRMEACYYDSSDQALQLAGVAYRIRLEGSQWVATVKAGGTSTGGLHQRQEWNVPVAEPVPSLEYFQQTEAEPLLTRVLGDNPLEPLFSTAFDRQTIELNVGDGSRVELAVDVGSILAGDRDEPIAEVELELLAGNPTAVLQLGAELSRTVPLVVEPRSKYFRGLLLAGLADDEHPAEEAGPPPFSTDAGSAVRILLTQQLHQVFVSLPLFLGSIEDAEAMHRFRIQLRRLRSLLSFAKPLADPEGYADWQSRLRDWSRSTNPLRETDVILATWQEIATDGHLTLQPPAWLEMMLGTERTALAGTLTESLAGGQATPLLLGFWAWLAGAESFPGADEQAWSEFALSRLSGWLDDMRRLAKDLDPNDPMGIHGLRIQGKKLRYSLESLQLRDRKSRALLARLKRLQDSLGIFRDSQVLNDTLNSWLNTQASRVLYRDAGILLGWTARTRQGAVRDYEKQWQRFKRAARRWQKDKDPQRRG